MVKRGVGNVGSWAYGARDPESSAVEAVANVFYTKLRKAVEAASGSGEVGRLNKELGDLIPIEMAVARRIPVDARQNLVSLGTLISSLPAVATGSMGRMAATAGYIASKAPTTANALYKAAEMKPLAGKLTAGMAQQVKE